MGWAHVGTTASFEATSSAASLQRNLGQTATNGNALVVWAAVNAGSLPGLGSAACTDSAGNSYTEVLTKTDATRHNRLSCFIARNITGAPTWVKITPSISAFITIISADEYSGLDNAATPQTSSAGPTTSGSATAGSITPTNANSLCSMAITHDGSSNETLTADTGNGYTERGHQPTTTGMPGESQDASKSAATNPAVAIGGSPHWIAGLVVFAPASGTLFTKTVLATQGQTARLVRQPQAIRKATQAQAAKVVRQPRLTRKATQSQTATLHRQAQLARKATQAQVATVLRAVTRVKTLLALQGQSAVLVRQARLVRRGTQAQTAKIVRQVGAVRKATQAQAATLARRAGRTLRATQAQAAILVRRASRTLLAAQAQVATLARLKAFVRTLTATQGQTARVVRQARLIRKATQGQLATLDLRAVIFSAPRIILSALALTGMRVNVFRRARIALEALAETGIRFSRLRTDGGSVSDLGTQAGTFIEGDGGSGGGGGESFCANLSAIWSMDEAAGSSRLDDLGTFDLAEVAGPIAAAHGHVGTIGTFTPLADEFAAEIAYGGTQFLEAADGAGLKAATGLCITGWFRLDDDGAGDPTGEQLIVEKDGEWGLAYAHDTGLYFWVMIGGVRVQATASGVLLAGTDDWYWVAGWYDLLAGGGPTVNIQKGDTSTRDAVVSAGAPGVLDVTSGPLRFGGGSFVP